MFNFVVLQDLAHAQIVPFFAQTIKVSGGRLWYAGGDAALAVSVDGQRQSVTHPSRNSNMKTLTLTAILAMVI
ncbi:MAG: hypothetical protein NTV22_12415, partial [bacterium]|nr:hypothetical protein [bacterium]